MMKNKVVLLMVGLIFSLSAFAAPSLGPAEELYQVECSYFDSDNTDWDTYTSTNQEMNFAIDWCEATGGVARVYFDE